MTPAEKKTENSKQDDLIHVRAAISGDQDAYSWLLKKYKPSLQSLIYKMVFDKKEVEDLTQEAFIKAFASLPSYNQEFAFSTWLFRIGINNTIDYIRKKKLTTFSIESGMEDVENDGPFEIPDTSFLADKEIILEQRQQIINNAIDSLPERYKKVIELRHQEDMSYEEIAELMDLPLGTVKAHLFRARELLNKQLKDKIRMI
ncbi:MAG: sigma-70 family RNA polymerase sigma factor [Ignavibacteria bacterium]|nr:sigma-70 family RNA polymerase sigma factor [Ignavibacteria bacterium]